MCCLFKVLGKMWLLWVWIFILEIIEKNIFFLKFENNEKSWMFELELNGEN